MLSSYHVPPPPLRSHVSGDNNQHPSISISETPPRAVSNKRAMSGPQRSLYTEPMMGSAIVHDLVAAMDLRVNTLSRSIMEQMDAMGKQVDDLESRINALLLEQQQQQATNTSDNDYDGDKSPRTTSSSVSSVGTATTKSPKRSAPVSSSSSSSSSSTVSSYTTPTTRAATTTRSPRRGFFSKSGPCEI